MDRHILEMKSKLEEKIKTNLDKEIENIPNLSDRELLENIYRELLVFVRYRQLENLNELI